MFKKETTNNKLVNFTIILTVGLTIFLFSREHITFLGSWLVTISLKKFLIAIILYFCAFATILFITKNMLKIKLSAIVMLATIGLGSAHSDFFSLKGGESFYGNTHSYYYKNNRYLNDIEKIWEIKYSSPNVEVLWESICNEFDNFCNDESIINFQKAESAMLIVSAFFDYGNELEENQNEAGCVGNSEETNLNIVSKNFLLYRSSDIGCCNDFAYMLASFLNHLKIDNQLITIPGHKANMIYLDDSTLYIDANTNLIVDNFLKQQDKIFFIYPHPNVSQQSHRFSMLNFQNNLIENLSYHEHFIYNYIKLNPSDTIDQQFLN